MPPPPGHRLGADPTRDYQLLPGDDAEAQQQAKQQAASPSRLFRLAREELRTLAAASLLLLFAAAAQTAFPKLAGDLIDVAIQQQTGGGGGPAKEEARHQTSHILWEILAVVAVGGAADGLRSWLFQSASERVMFRLRVRLFEALLRQEVGFFDRVRTGELSNRLAEDTRMMKSVATTSIANALRAAAICTLGLAMMFATSALLTCLTLSILPPLFALFALYARASRRIVREQLTASARAATVAEESFSNLRTVRSFAKEGAVSVAYGAAQGETLRQGLHAATLDGLFFPLHSSLATGAIMVVLWYGARLVIDARMTAGALSSFVVYAVFVAGNAGMLMGVGASIVQALGASERVFQLLDRQPQQDLGSGSLCPEGTPGGAELVLREVHFCYPSRPGAWVLQGLSLHVAPGSKVALVGPSGGGKSTIVSLIESFYEPQRGAVLLDGVPLPLIDHAYLHSQVALVGQEPVLFADTIAANIAFGLPGGASSREQLEEAARVANAHDFICSFPQGYDTLVGERGVRLSGGQKQRIAIARAVAMRPRLLLLDEATSALDAESEHLVQEALDRAAAGRSVLVIAHRLSTVQSADCVVVVQGGVVAEQGTHAQLLAAGGVYAAVVRRQLLAGEHQQQHDAAVVSDNQGGGAPVPDEQP